MSYGQKILEKYGFKTGEGLGKNGNGIKTAIKANFKVSLEGEHHRIFDSRIFSSTMLVSVTKDLFVKTTGGNVFSMRLPATSMFKNRNAGKLIWH